MCLNISYLLSSFLYDRESAAAYVMKDLLEERALLSVYDPQVIMLHRIIFNVLLLVFRCRFW